MFEVIPIVAGLVVGYAVAEHPWRRSAAVRITVTSVTVALIVGLVSGELAESPLYLAIDYSLCALSATVAYRARQWLNRAAHDLDDASGMRSRRT